MKTNRSVLLIDDNETDNFIHKRLIELTGFSSQVVVKNSGKQALEYLTGLVSTPDRMPSIVFLDINMPVVDGFVFLFELGNFPEVILEKLKVVVLSSSDNQKDIDRIVDNEHVLKFLTKPLLKEHLEEIADLHT